MTATAPIARLSSLPPSRRRLLAVAVSVLLVLAAAIPLGLKALHGSSSTSAPAIGSAAGSGAGSRVGSGSGAAGTDVPAGAGAKAPAVAPGATQVTGSTDTATVVESKIARSAWVGIKVVDLTGSAARARVIATDAGGQVTSENVVTSADPTGGPVGLGGAGGSGGLDPRHESGTSVPDVGVDEARLVLSVPATSLDDVLTQLSKTGSVSYRSSQSQDVTDSYIDAKARLQPMRDGIDRVRALLAKTTDLQQVITLESELSRRQAELDSLAQRLAKLDALTTTSDVTVTFWTDATTPVQAQDGIAGGLRTAWESLLGSVTVILTGLAALLPWLVLLVPLTLLAVRVWRRRGAAVPAGTGASPSGD